MLSTVYEDFMLMVIFFTLFVFLLLNTFYTRTLFGTIADLKRQRALVRILIIEDRLIDLENVL